MNFSFEFFPPKSDKAELNLWSAINALAPLEPEFVSVTYGAGGTTRTRTHDCVRRIVQETNLKPAAHLTCVSATKSEVDHVIDDYEHAGVRHIVALRGDMPDFAPYSVYPGGYLSTVDLVKAISDRGCFDVSVSAYPEKHPESPSLQHDIDLLKAKQDAGATRAITQFAFDTFAYVRFRDALMEDGLSIEICPGIMPTTNFSGAFSMAEKCGTSVPEALRERFLGLEDDPAAREDIATSFALEQCEILKAEGFGHVHFYTLNQAALTMNVCRALEKGAV